MVSPEFKFIKPGEIRTRLAPSPTGPLHIGTARTALFNYLFAKKYQGEFILRIEDTDPQRSNPKWAKDIIEGLKWLGIEWSEGPDIGGKFGPYRQSQRAKIYKKYLKKLLDEDKAYYCFCSEKDLWAQRQYQMSVGQPPRYSGKCRDLSRSEVEKYLAQKKFFLIRFKTPIKKMKFKDLIRGDLEFDSSLLGDIAIAKSLSLPLYNFAVVIDDFEMKISQVIRGEDLLPNTPKQILIQEALDFPQPEYAHLPLILGPDRSKLSKRHGAMAIAQYRKIGYLPETLINFMAFLGWNPGTEREIYSLTSLIKEFSLEKVQKGGAIFNIKRLDFLNGFYIRQKSLKRLGELCFPYLIEAGFIEKVKNLIRERNQKPRKLILEEKPKFKIKETSQIIDRDYLEKILALYQERLKKLSEISELTDFFFKEKLDYDKELLKWQKMTNQEVNTSLDKLEKILFKIKPEDWRKENLEKTLMPEAQKMGDRGKLLWPLRVALTGKEASAGPFEIAEILGREKTLKRIKEARGLIKN